jgi:predicted O-methyltransferase YrrM
MITLAKLIEPLKPRRGAEIGVRNADTSQHLLKVFPDLTLYLIDHYPAYEDGLHKITKEMQVEWYAVALERLRPFEDRTCWVLEPSIEAAEVMPDAVLDFVFIDANHTYPHPLEDMEAWWPKVRKGGLMTGHDYLWPGVRQSLDEFIAEKDLGGYTVHHKGDVWVIQR